jgi:aryl-alcohol dehydrogenase-like predicted oxidoreductase
MPSSSQVPRRKFGRHHEEVSALALGGYHIGSVKTEREAIRVVHEAMDAGLTFMDNAWDYHEGLSETRMGKALKGRREQAFLMTKVCTHGRDGRVALRQLEQSLRRLQTDYLDLWQIHECVYENEPERHFAPGGVVDALEKARAAGKVRYVGFTGHKDPELLLRMLGYGFPFDSCQLPLNGFDATFRSFERFVLPELTARGIAVIGMKSLSGDGSPVKKRVVTVEAALRYAMSLPVATTVSGIDSLRILRQNLRIARNFKPMSDRDMAAHRKRLAPVAADGRFELYKTTAIFEGDEGRRAHGFPTSKELSA